VDGIYDPPTEAQQLGSLVHQAIDDPRTPWLKTLREWGWDSERMKPIRKLLTKVHTKRAPEREVSMRAETKSGVKLFSIFDGFDKADRVLYEYKTTGEKKRWTQWKVDTDLQLSFYAYVYWLNTHSFFREIRLYALHVVPGNCETFVTTRSRTDILRIEKIIDQSVVQMQREGIWELRKSRVDKNRENQGKLGV